VDGRPITHDDFARLVSETIPVADPRRTRLGEPTEFELLTASCSATSPRLGRTVALVEVGLGGRLDATHAWDGGVARHHQRRPGPHTDRLGPTVSADRARERAAIIERADRAVTGAAGEALAIVRRRCARLGRAAGGGCRRRACAGLDP